MSLRTAILPLIALCAIAAAPPVEQATSESATQAERRLRACLTTHSDGHATLAAALAAARAACKPRIDDLRDVRVLEATAGMAPAEAQVVVRRITRKLNDEIAYAVANLTGLPAPETDTHAHH